MYSFVCVGFDSTLWGTVNVIEQQILYWLEIFQPRCWDTVLVLIYVFFFFSFFWMQEQLLKVLVVWFFYFYFFFLSVSLCCFFVNFCSVTRFSATAVFWTFSLHKAMQSLRHKWFIFGLSKPCFSKRKYLGLAYLSKGGLN